MIFKNISRLVTMSPTSDRHGPLGVIEDACIVTRADRIEWIGKRIDLPKKTGDETSVDLRGDIVLPGFVDCHTHLVHAGSRENEFRMRAAGKTYQEIAAAGGGIMSTVLATRAASEEELLVSAKERADEMISRGITTIEIKSGYGLDVATEEKILKVAKRLGEEHPIDVVSTFLGAHVVPAEYKSDRSQYVKLVAGDMLPRFAKAGLCKYCDIFVEEGAFTKDEARLIAKTAKSLGLGLRLHVDQFGDGGGGELAAEVGAVSADHLDHVSESGIAAMAKALVIAVVLPGAVFFTKGKKAAPARGMIDEGVRVAVSTDYNPGTSPTTDILLCATMAVTQMGITIDEALLGITRNAATSLDLEKEVGSIGAGMRADFASFAVPHEDFLLYRFGTDFARTVVKDGNIIKQKGHHLI